MSLLEILPLDTPNQGRGKINSNFQTLLGELDEHRLALGNPHGTTASQVPLSSSNPLLSSSTTVDDALESLASLVQTINGQISSINGALSVLNTHLSRTDNPHNTTAGQVSVSSSVFDYLASSKNVETALVSLKNSVTALENAQQTFSRDTVTFSVGPINTGEYTIGNFPLGKSFMLIKISASAPCRIRLYSKDTYRNQDVSRPIGIDPVELSYGGEHGVIGDFVLQSGNLELDLAPFVFGGNMDPSPSPAIYYTLDNLSGSAQTFNLTFTRIVLEV